MNAPNHRWRKVKNALMQALTLFCGLLVIAPLGLIFFHLIRSGAGAVTWDFFTQLPKPVGEIGGGMANAIVGTFVLLGLASLIWGIVVYALVVLPMKSFSVLAGGIVLGMIMIPLIMRTTEEVLHLVPNGYREAALALGISQWRTVVQIVMRTALKGIITGVLLAVARVAGETAPLLFTAFGNRFWNHSLAEPIAALPLQIFTYAISPYEDWHRQAWAGALVLLMLVLAINVSVRFLARDKLLSRS